MNNQNQNTELRELKTETHLTATKDEMLARISLLSAEMDANDEENMAMQAEIDELYAKIDAKG